ncbi:WecB/TagA/CpsF family glycosyltransferase [Loktanella sp. DJP18]|uniref:WecB/TagA/CpsF family glycosyltransferase n=1 Tax=Loktanella sp. DJP18 TaxID=3409788 RepID=UPI003BB5EAB8
MIHITHPTRDGLLADIAARFATGEGFTLATLNLDHIVKLRRDPAFLAAYLVQSHVVADGNPIVWLSRLAGREVELIPGSELIVPLAEMAAHMGVPVACLGATRETLDQAVVRLKEAYPGLRIVARIAPPFGLDVTGPAGDGMIAQLRTSGARLCFLALGAPKQEILAARAAAALPACGFVSIGAGLDFIAGSQTRAPRLVRRLALEWAWRMASNPGRLTRRYAACAAILPGLASTARRQRGL